MTSGAQVHGPHSAEVDGRERSAVDPLVEATADVLLVALAIETATGRMRTAELEERVTTIGAVEAVARRCLEQPPAETETETGTATVGLVAETETIPRIGDPVVVTETRPGARFGRLLAGMMTTTDAAVAEVPVRGGLARAKTVIVMMTTDAAVVEVPVPGGLARAKIVIVTVTTTTAAAAAAELVLGVLVRAKIVIVTMTAKEQEEKTIIGDVVLRRPLGLDVQAGLVIVIARTRMTIFAVGMTTVRTTAETEMTEKSPPAGTTAMNLLVMRVELHRGDREPAKDHRRPPKEMPSQRNLRTDAAVVEVPVPGGLARAKIVIVTMTAKEQEEKTIIGDVVLRRPLGLDVQAGLVIVIARTRMTIFAVGMTTVRTTAETEMTEKSPPAGTTAMNLLVVSKVELHRGDREPAKDHRRPPKEMPSQRNLRHPRRMSRRRPPSPSSRRPRNLILSLSVGLRSLWLMRRKMRLRSSLSSPRRMSRRRPPSPSSARPRNVILGLSVGLRSLWLMRRKMRLRSRRSSHRLRTFLHPLS
mmetsp:Transcript_10909/g.23809  ORF Transcript_10909/g.23809 Transcript_10909/m.23809 type:complete len:531 (+) Transcript_10909:322-1914(+)